MNCFGIKGAIQHRDVQVAWAPFKMLDHATIFSKPGRGIERGELKKGKTVFRQSVRNPKHLRKPALRPAIVGKDGGLYIWCSAREGAITGWVYTGAVAHDMLNTLALGLDEWKGPAGEDFEWGRGRPSPGKGPGCGKPSLKRPVRTVEARDAHWRYSAHGTGFHFAHRGDKVRVLLYAPQGFVLAEAVHTAKDGSLKPGARGYILKTALGL